MIKSIDSKLVWAHALVTRALLQSVPICSCHFVTRGQAGRWSLQLKNRGSDGAHLGSEFILVRHVSGAMPGAVDGRQCGVMLYTCVMTRSFIMIVAAAAAAGTWSPTRPAAKTCGHHGV